jgi:F-type H+-transporting ATPase subunit b
MLELLAVAEVHAEPTAFGIEPGGYVAIAMIVVLLIMLWVRVPSIIARMLDARIAGIREQLDEAAKLRAEAEALKAQYEAKAREADAEIAGLKSAAERHAHEIVAKAEADAEALVARHQAMAEDKIAAAERAAVEELRAKAAEAAAFAARKLIQARHDEAADRQLVDQAIAKI